MTMKDLLTPSEVCVLTGISIYTLNRWYKFKAENPDNEYAKMLPEVHYTQIGNRRPRYWKHNDIYKLIEFKAKVPKGCAGIMGSVNSHKYDKLKEDK